MPLEGGSPDLDSSVLVRPSLSLNLGIFRGVFSSFSGDFPICPFPLSRLFKRTYREHSRKGSRTQSEPATKNGEPPSLQNSTVHLLSTTLCMSKRCYILEASSSQLGYQRPTPGASSCGSEASRACTTVKTSCCLSTCESGPLKVRPIPLTYYGVQKHVAPQKSLGSSYLGRFTSLAQTLWMSYLFWGLHLFRAFDVFVLIALPPKSQKNYFWAPLPSDTKLLLTKFYSERSIFE